MGEASMFETKCADHSKISTMDSPPAATVEIQRDTMETSSDDRFAALSSIGGEYIYKDKLRLLLKKKIAPICYVWFEPSDMMDIEQGIMKTIYVNKMVQAGCTVKILMADWFLQRHSKIGTDLNKIRAIGNYNIEMWKATGMNLDRVELVWLSDELNLHAINYWPLAVDVSRKYSMEKMASYRWNKAPKRPQSLPSAEIFYPCMQVAAILCQKCRTDKIVFKLFEKVPSDLPPILRSQILGWLSTSPTDIESYIRPGCIILTVYLRLVESTWREVPFFHIIVIFSLVDHISFLQLSENMSLYLDKLLSSSTDNFWASGLVFVMVRHQLAFMHNGQVMLDRPLAPNSHNYCKVLCVSPVAAPYSATVNFRVEGFNLVSTSSRLICSIEGRCIFEEDTAVVAEDTEHEDIEYLSFCCSLPGSRGRGFMEDLMTGESNSRRHKTIFCNSAFITSALFCFSNE